MDSTEMTEYGSLASSLASLASAKFSEESYAGKSEWNISRDSKGDTTTTKLPQTAIDNMPESRTEGSKDGVNTVGGKRVNNLDSTKCTDKTRNGTEADSDGKKAQESQSAPVERPSDPATGSKSSDASNETSDKKPNQRASDAPNQKNGKDIHGTGEGFDSKQKSSSGSDQEELVKTAEAGNETDECEIEKSAEEEDAEKRNDDPYVDQDKNDEPNASDEDPYVKREPGPAVKDGPATEDEEVPTQILVMKDGSPVPRSHGSDAGKEIEGLPNPAFEQTLLIESLWR